MIRPTYNGSNITTPNTALSIGLLGANIYKNIALSADELRAIQKLYGFVKEKSNEKPEPPIPPNREDFDFKWEYEDAVKKYERELALHDNWEDPKALLQSGSDRNAMRYAESDGLRIIAWLAKYVPVGEDPLKLVIQFAIDAGFDVNCEEVDYASSVDD